MPHRGLVGEWRVVEARAVKAMELAIVQRQPQGCMKEAQGILADLVPCGA